MQQEFRIPESTVDRLIKKQMLIALPVLAVSIGFGTFMAFYATGKLPSMAYILPICLLAVSIVSFVVYRGFRRQKNELKSFHLTINDHRLICIQKNSPAVQLNRSEIKSVQKKRNGQLTISGNNNETIVVPSQISHMNDLENYLGTENITVYKTDGAANKMYFLFGVMLIATFIILRVNNKAVVGITAAVMFALLGWVVVELQKDKAAFAVYKKALLWLGFVLLLVIFRVVLVFFK